MWLLKQSFTSLSGWNEEDEDKIKIHQNVPKRDWISEQQAEKGLKPILNIFYELSVDCIILSTTGCHTNWIHIVYCYFLICLSRRQQNSKKQSGSIFEGHPVSRWRFQSRLQ